MTLIPVDQILPNPEQPRTNFDQAELQSLADSIKEHGLIQPINVEGPFPDGSYILIDGERRLRAHRLAGMSDISAVVHYPNGHEPETRLTLALIANMQRSDLDPVEEGRAYKRLKSEKLTLFRIAQMVGRSYGHIEIRLKLLELDPEIQELYSKRLLPIDPIVIYGLANLPDDKRVPLARKFAQSGASTLRIRKAITRVMHAADDPDIPLNKKGGKSPAMAMSETGESSKIFKMLGKIGVSLPAWELVTRAADETCDACELSDMASTQMCRDCPAVELLKRLNRLTEKE